MRVPAKNRAGSLWSGGAVIVPPCGRPESAGVSGSGETAGAWGQEKPNQAHTLVVLPSRYAICDLNGSGGRRVGGLVLRGRPAHGTRSPRPDHADHHSGDGLAERLGRDRATCRRDLGPTRQRHDRHHGHLGQWRHRRGHRQRIRSGHRGGAGSGDHHRHRGRRHRLGHRHGRAAPRFRHPRPGCPHPRLRRRHRPAHGHRGRCECPPREGAEVSWGSDDTSVASVSDDGLVTAVAPGTATITATSGDASASAEATVRQPPSPDREALVAFHEATGGDGWTNRENWLSSRPVGEWYGVGVNGEGRVTALHMGANNLVGSLPPETGRMPALERIYLPFNGLRGGIPRELGELSRLRLLRLDSNDLTGPIPRELGSLGNLEELQLSQNNLEGPIPGELGNLTSLESLALGANNYRSPIPPELGKLANLKVLSIRSAWVTGEIPPELGALAGLEVLNLSFNRLRGPIPAEIVAGLTNLRSISLASNRFSGPIPPELGNLATLGGLDLGNNQLSGPIPPELGDLSALEWLRLEGNDLTGIIPPSLGQLSDAGGAVASIPGAARGRRTRLAAGVRDRRGRARRHPSSRPRPLLRGRHRDPCRRHPRAAHRDSVRGARTRAPAGNGDRDRG